MTDTATRTADLSEAEIIEELDQWLNENWDPEITVEEWWNRLGLSGWGAPMWPEEWFGKDLNRAEAVAVQNRIAEFGALGAPGGLGLLLAGPTIIDHGTDEQKDTLVRDIITGQKAWCQLFSEPGAGSDVAGLSSRAVKDGDEWIVNGQKVWTTLAHVSSFGTLVARSDPEQPKHKGLTHFVVDMKAPGVEVRPLRQMTGDAEFNEVYFTDVRIPDSERLGEVGEGWRVAITTLMNERVSIGGAIPKRGSGAIGEVRKVFEEHVDGADAARRDEFMKLWIRADVTRLTNIRASQNRKVGNPGPEGSVGKLSSAELNKDLYAFAVDCMGPEGQLYGSYDMEQTSGTGLHGVPTTQLFLRMRANSIEGGTTEIMKNILGERVLGLPGDIRTDKDVAWSEVPRN